MQVAFGGDISQDPHVLSLLDGSDGLLQLLDSVLHGVEKVLRNPLLEVSSVKYVLNSFARGK